MTVQELKIICKFENYYVVTKEKRRKNGIITANDGDTKG